MKLLNTEVYLLLIQEEAEIKNKDILYNEIFGVYESEANGAVKSHYKIIAYYPLTKEAKELDLPWLPNPFKDKVDVEKLACAKYNVKNGIHDYDERYYNTINVAKAEAFIEGYKAAQSKQFTLEDVKKAIEMARDYNDDWLYTEEEITQSLSTQQLPKEFVILDMEYLSTDGTWKNVRLPLLEDFAKTAVLRYKTITNSEGKQELVGTYKY